VGARLKISHLSDELKEQILTVFGETRIFNESDWDPESEERGKVQMAVDRCKWFTDAAFRLRIYGEFAQNLYPQYNYEQLPMLPAQHKETVKSLYVAVLSDGIIRGQFDCLKEALKCFSRETPLADTNTTDRIGRERAARWNVQSVPESSPAPVRSESFGMEGRWSEDGWR
jgi:hypothetical protein